PPPLPAGPLPPEGVAEGGGRGVRLAHGLGRAFEAMPDRAEGARAVLRLVEILRESWMDFANRQQIRAPSGFSRSGRVELNRGSHILAPDHAAPVLAGFRLNGYVIEAPS
ncbi:hypothetical protein APM11_26000, partial [Salmonella enterica subsp. enterica serovar Derby]|nr:hypothetical protein [Salmonella enterica subsp. enterica serovar Derby]MDU98847.1 hypothetical protein [Salmonella enterica]MEN05153.1 hypothetical protein [Salmonella enterica]